jgi:hypothetical protein
VKTCIRLCERIHKANISPLLSRLISNGKL